MYGSSGPVSAELSLTCARCLEEFTFSVSSKLDIELLPAAKNARRRQKSS